ncbi:MAG: hypothetical protein ABIG63_05030 [Chloroflexota bacterium]
MKINYHPRTPLEFGRVLHALSILSLHTHENHTSPAKFLATALDVDSSLVNAWFRGQLRGNKSLSLPNFRKLILHFLNHPRNLLSTEDIPQFARAAGEDYALELERESFLAALAARKPVTVPQPHKEVCCPPAAAEVLRKDLIQKVQRGARRCQMLGSPLVLQGPPWIGKTTLLKQLARDPQLRRMFPDRVLIAQLDKNIPSSHQRVWLQESSVGFSPLAHR